MKINELVDNCLIDWENPKPFQKLYDYYLKNKNYTLVYLLSLHISNKSSNKIINKRLFEFEAYKQQCTYIDNIENYQPDKTKVSVIMPTKNRHSIIYKSITSVLSQSERDLELIIINDGGSDDLAELIVTIQDPRLRYIKLEKSLGASAARNYGVKAAHGKYIAYLDDDDIFYPDHLLTLINLLERKNSDFSYSNCKRTYGEYVDSEFIESSSIIPWQPINFDLNKLITSNYISTLNVLHKRECLFHIGGFNTDIRYCEDWELWIRIACSYKISNTSQITGEYRFRHQDNAEKNTSLTDKNLMTFYDKLLSEFHRHLFYYTELYDHFQRHNKLENCSFYQKKIFDLIYSEHYPFTKKQLTNITSIIKKNKPSISINKKTIIYSKIFKLNALKKIQNTILQLSVLYEKNLGWRLKN